MRYYRLVGLRLFVIIVLGTLSALLLLPHPVFAGPDTWTLTLSSGPTFRVPNLGNPPTSVLPDPNWYYSSQVFTVDETRTYNIQSSGDIWDPAHTLSGAELILYQGAFDPSNPLNNALEAVGGANQYPTITRYLTAGVSYTLVTTSWAAFGTGPYTITVSPLLPQLTINDVTATEGNSGTKLFTFTVSLSFAAEGSGVTFDIATANDTATTANGDYVAKSLTAQTIPAGSSTYTFNVTVNGDTVIENNETFFVNVTNVSGAIVADGQGLGTINNDDTTTLSINDVTQAEGSSGTTTFSFTVSLSAPAGPGGVTFNIATANGTATTADNDYVAKSLTGQTIPAGASSYTFDVTVNGDTVGENDETFLVNVTNVSGIGASIADGQGQGTIINDDPPGLSINDVTQAEGDSGTTTFTFTVSLSIPAQSGGVTFDIATADGTATTANNDYVAKSLTGQTIAAGASSYTFDVTVNGDTVVESDETFLVNVTNVTGATVTDGQGQGTITNDDTTALSIDDVTHAEGDSGTTNYSFTVSLSAPAGPGGVTFDIATADDTATTANNDYVAKSLTGQTIAAGASSYTFDVTVNGDTVVESDETFLVNVTNVNGIGVTVADGQGQGTITNDDSTALSIDDVTRAEGDSGTTTFSFTVSLSVPAGPGGVTFDIATADGTATVANNDYVAQSLTGQTIAAGASSYTFNVIVNGDTTFEPDETFLVNVTNVSGIGVTVADGQGQGTITNDDGIAVSINDVTQAEGNSGTTAFSFTVSLSAPAETGGVTFDIATADGTATTADNDYVSKSLTGQTIPAGSSSYTFDVTVNGDTVVENDETFLVNITNVSGTGANIADGQGQGTITNDDSTALSIDDVTQAEGNSGTTTFSFTVSLSSPAGPGGVTFDIATADGTATTADSDYVAQSLTGQTIPAGSSSYTFDVTVNGDTAVENDETFLVNISNVSGIGATVADGQGQGTITNDDSTALSINDVTLAEGNSGTTTFSFTVSLSVPAGPGGVTFDIATADGTATTADSDYVAQSLTGQTIAAGASSYTFDVTVNGDTAIENDETFLVNVSNVSGIGATVADGQGLGTITNDDGTALSIDDVTLAEGNSGTTTFSFTVSLSVPAGPGGVSFDIGTADGTATVANSDYVAQSLTGQAIPAGSSTYTFNVQVNGDTVVENDETFLVNVSNVSGIGATVADGQGQGTITNDDSTALSINDVTQAEGNSGTTTFSFTVSLSAPAGPGGVTFDIATADGTATTADNDYVSKSLTGQTIPAGSSSYTFDVAVNGDGVVEADETFTVNVTNVAGLTVSVADGQGLGTITNDDTAGITVSAISGNTTESGGTATFTVGLTSQPIADVNVALTGVDATEGSLSSSSLTFTSADWHTPQPVTVTGLDDGIIDGDITYTVTATTSSAGDANYNAGLTGSVQITNVDNDSVPVADDDAYITKEDTTLTVDAANGVLNGDTGGNGNPFSAVLESGPTHGALVLNSDGSFTYTPNAGFFGTDSFTYHATDGTNDSNIATVTIKVALVNGDTIANDDSAEVGMNNTITLNVLANDVDPDGDPLHIANVEQPGHGQVTIKNNRVIYTPDRDFTGTDLFSYAASDPFGSKDTATVTITVWLPVPLCADFDGSTNAIIRADVPGGTVTDGSAFCRVLVENSVFVRQSAEVGQPEVLARGVIQAVDVFALHYDGTPTVSFNNPITVCLQGQGAFLYLDATVSPRAVIELPIFVRSGYTCASVPNAGTVVLVSGTASVTSPAPEITGPAISLADCMVTTRDILNLRADPGANGAIIRMIPYDVTLTALERTGSWFYVDYLGERGWVSAAYVTPQGTCGQ